ncbi:MAG: lipopolysaccharide biosynthesis protein [Nitrospirae bacterium]|nr:MAG: lipopolysaccharide biosynthesis protein [Nitrospirota bacterium]
MKEMMNYRPEEDDVNLLDYWRVIRKQRRMLIRLFCSAVLLAMVVSLLMPKVYESTASILPQIDSKEGLSGLGGLGSLLALSGSGGAGGAGALAQGLGITLPGMPATPTDIFVAMLKSRIMADAVIKQFDLMKLYNDKTMQDARKDLESDTTIKVSKEKVIKVTVEAKNPQLASDIANFYVANLDRLNRTLNVTKSGQNRVFIEKRLVETKTNLVKAEEALREFQTKNKAVHLEAQGRAAIEAAAMIQAEISATEVQLQVMEGYLTLDNPDVVRMRSSLGELKKQLTLLEFGKGGKGQLPGDRMHPAFITVPSLAIEYARLFREVKVQETLYTMLTSQYEQAKIAEARDTPSVQVLDQGVPAEKKSRPRIGLNMVIAGVLALFLGIFLAFFLEYLERVKRASAARETSATLETSSPSHS